VKAAPNPTSKIAFLREIAFDSVLSFIAQTPMCVFPFRSTLYNLRYEWQLNA